MSEHDYLLEIQAHAVSVICGGFGIPSHLFPDRPRKVPALPPAATAGGFVYILRRYVGNLEYLANKTTFVCETADGPRGFCDCAGLLFLGLRDVGILSSNVDLNFAGAVNREREMLRLLKRHGRRVAKGAILRAGDVLVSGASGALHVQIVSVASESEMWVIEASHAGAQVWERRLDEEERWNRRGTFRFFEN